MTYVSSPSVGDLTTVLAADDLNGTPATTFAATGAGAVIIAQIANGTAGTLGIDVIEISHDGGSTWFDDDFTLFDSAGDAVTGAILNAAGVEPSGAALFTIRGADLTGPTLVRCVRNATDNAASVAWTTGAPEIAMLRIG